MKIPYSNRVIPPIRIQPYLAWECYGHGIVQDESKGKYDVVVPILALLKMT
jgi:hypothetical protein